MRTERLVELEKAMNDWLGAGEDRDFVVGEDTARHMAIAALAVLNGLEEAQKHAIANNYLKEVD